MTKFKGTVSIVAKLNFCIEADSEDDVRNKIFNSSLPFSLKDEEGNPIKITNQQWYMYDSSNKESLEKSHLVDLVVTTEE